MNIVKEHRIGEFDISSRLLKDSPEEVRDVLSNFLIVRAEAMFHKDTIQYTAYSHHFDKSAQGTLPKQYAINMLSNGNYTVT